MRGDPRPDESCYTCIACNASEAPMTTSVSVRLADRTAKALERLAKATDRPKTYVIEKALESYLAEYADYQIALDRLRDKDDPVISSAELRKRLGRRKN